MGFDSGRVSFTRFRVAGDAPDASAVLEALGERAFQESDAGAPEELETGWVTGQHLFDTQFRHEANVYGTPGNERFLFAMRMDTHRVPPDVKRAYRAMHEQTAAASNPSGFVSRQQKKEAAELADRQIREEMAAGRYRRSKLVPLLWDRAAGVVYCASTASSAVEAVSKLFRETFELALEPLSAGALAHRLLAARGRERDHEDMRPTAWTPAPAGEETPATPPVPWAQSAVDAKDFLGNELLVWLWWRMETQGGLVEAATESGTDTLATTLDRQLQMDCAWGLGGRQTLRGEAPTRLAEAGEALAGGKWPRSAGMILADREHQWELTLQADRFDAASVALPQVTEAETPRDALEQRLEHLARLARNLERIFDAYLTARTATDWPETRGEITEWIRSRRRAAAPQSA